VVGAAQRGGGGGGSRGGVIRSRSRTAGERVGRGRPAGRTAELLGPVEKIARESGMEDGGSGFAIFRSFEYTAQYYLPDRPVD
jgi:hypothetical protein